MRRRLRQTPRWLVVRSGRRQPPGLVRAALAASAHTVQEAEAAALRRGAAQTSSLRGPGCGEAGREEEGPGRGGGIGRNGGGGEC